MTVNLTPEQKRRIENIIGSGAYERVEDIVETALTALEQRALPSFDGTEEELKKPLAAGLDSEKLSEEEFWSSTVQATNTLLAEQKERTPLHGCASLSL